MGITLSARLSRPATGWSGRSCGGRSTETLGRPECLEGAGAGGELEEELEEEEERSTGTDGTTAQVIWQR